MRTSPRLQSLRQACPRLEAFQPVSQSVGADEDANIPHAADQGVPAFWQVLQRREYGRQ